MTAEIFDFRTGKKILPRKPRLASTAMFEREAQSAIHSLLKSCERMDVPWHRVKTWLELALGYVNFKLIAEKQKGLDHGNH